MISEVVKYHIEKFQASMDPDWWGCRFSDMKVYVKELNPGDINDGCMGGFKYPFDVWKFIREYSRKEFFEEAEIQINEYYKKFGIDANIDIKETQTDWEFRYDNDY